MVQISTAATLYRSKHNIIIIIISTWCHCCCCYYVTLFQSLSMIILRGILILRDSFFLCCPLILSCSSTQLPKSYVKFLFKLLCLSTLTIMCEPCVYINNHFLSHAHCSFFVRPDWKSEWKTQDKPNHVSKHDTIGETLDQNKTGNHRITTASPQCCFTFFSRISYFKQASFCNVF